MQKTLIQYTHFSSNPIRPFVKGEAKGWFCTKVNRGCKYCYAETMNRRLGNKLAFSKMNEGAVEFVINEKELKALSEVKPSKVVFVCDMTDLFHHMITDEQIDEIITTLAGNPEAIYLVLTKRPRRMATFVASKKVSYDNIWFGVSACDNETLEKAVAELTPRPINTWLSLEPFTGDITGSTLLDALGQGGFRVFDWVVVGGESGRSKNIALCTPEWIEGVVGDCMTQKVPVFVKQMGSMWAKFRGIHKTDSKGSNPYFWPEGIRHQQTPSKWGKVRL